MRNTTRYRSPAITHRHPPRRSVRAGGIDKRFETGSLCTSIADGAYVIADGRTGSGPDCFQRENFGVNGVADARQCGVHGDGSTDDTALLQNCLDLANTLHVPVVNTGGGIVLANSADIEIPSYVTLTCGGAPGGGSQQLPITTHGPYYTRSNSLIIHRPLPCGAMPTACIVTASRVRTGTTPPRWEASPTHVT